MDFQVFQVREEKQVCQACQVPQELMDPRDPPDCPGREVETDPQVCPLTSKSYLCNQMKLCIL